MTVTASYSVADIAVLLLLSLQGRVSSSLTTIHNNINPALSTGAVAFPATGHSNNATIDGPLAVRTEELTQQRYLSVR